MKKRKLCLIVLGLSFAMLNGCSNSSESVQTTEASTKETEVEETSAQADIQEQLNDLQDQVNQIGDELGELFENINDKTEEQAVNSGDQETTSETEDELSTEAETQSSTPNGIRPEFKQAMDSYEEFFDEYCAFMDRFKNSDNSLSMMSDYADFMTKYANAMNDLESLKDSDMNSEETAYYVEVMNRINTKLLEVAQ